MALQGDIQAYARDELPATFDALSAAGPYALRGAVAPLGEDGIMRRVRLVCTRVFGRVLTVDEQEALDERVKDLLGKLVALELIPAGRDFWSKQSLSMAASGRNENVTFTERARELVDLQADLTARIARLWTEVADLVPVVDLDQNARSSAPVVRASDGWMTIDPSLMGAAYGVVKQP
jgi:hypothetical protein